MSVLCAMPPTIFLYFLGLCQDQYILPFFQKELHKLQNGGYLSHRLHARLIILVTLPSVSDC